MKVILTATLFALALGGCTFDPITLRALRDEGVAADQRSQDSSNSARDVHGGHPDLHQQDTRPHCLAEQEVCSGQCVDPLNDPYHCGGCGQACAADQHCDVGVCCDSGWINCGGGSCVDPQSDPANCGQCGAPCPHPNTCANSVCTINGCADGTDEQLFEQGMRGCAGQLHFADRAELCARGFRVCTAAEWVARRNGLAPIYNYWIDDILRYNGTSIACWVSLTGGTKCTSASSPMRVCSGHVDPLGNLCNWIGCGYGSYPPNDHFGGCNDNLTAGALCCPE